MNARKTLPMVSAMAIAMAGVAGGQMPGAPQAQPEVEIEAESEELIETFGFVVGVQSGVGDLDLDEEEFEAFLEGMRRANERESVPPEIGELIPQMQAYLSARQARVVEGRAGENRAEAAEFFAELQDREGIQQTEEGLYYQIDEEGVGDSPGDTDTVRIHYEGRLLDDTIFDSTKPRGEPAEFPLTGVIPGMRIGLSQLREGGRATLFIPPDLAYGDQSQPTIPPGSALIFEVELLEVIETEQQEFSPEMVPQMPQQ